MSYDVIVIGAGAAGLMAAGTAASEGKRVLLLEKMERAGRKIRITGKGRCNLTNTKSKKDFLDKVRANAEFFTPAFNSFSNRATVKFFRKEEVKLETERGDRVFPASGKAWDIANALVYWAEEAGVEIQYHTKVIGIRTIGNRVLGVTIITKRGFERNLEAPNVILCTGGASYPATGSTGDGYGFAHSLGHNIEEIRPSLVALVSDSELAHALTGVRLKNVNVTLYIDEEVADEEFGEIEFGSRGIEGAVALRLSRMAVDALIANKRVRLGIDTKTALMPETLVNRIDREVELLMEEENPIIADLARKLLPRAMVYPIIKEINLDPEAPLSTFTQGNTASLIGILKHIPISIVDYGPFEEAIVTAGGISVEDIDPNTLQSKLIKGMYFAGEVLDIDADTGGYNLQIAFSTGYLAGKLKN